MLLFIKLLETSLITGLVHRMQLPSVFCAWCAHASSWECIRNDSAGDCLLSVAVGEHSHHSCTQKNHSDIALAVFRLDRSNTFF
jgi:hypothetical protein